MASAGYVYVLINPSLPDCVKIGKTTRDTAQRAAELSAATGVPTPFMVAYEAYFHDCDSAESFIHAHLESKGVRLAQNREFFSIKPPDAINAVIYAQSQLGTGAPPDDTDESDDDDLLSQIGEDDLSELTLSSQAQSKPANPWDSVLAEARLHYYGDDDTIVDYAEAMRLYKQAARLGCSTAYAAIGNMYERGEGVNEDKTKALEFYKEGARKGNPYCYWKMGDLFYWDYKNTNNQVSLENADKCFRMFVEKYSPEFDLDAVEVSMASVFSGIGAYTIIERIPGQLWSRVLTKFVCDNGQEMLAYTNRIIEMMEADGETEYAQRNRQKYQNIELIIQANTSNS